jgi:hypothetical protein
VPDEVTSGKNLALCVRAHVKIEEALLRSFKRRSGCIATALDKKMGLLRLTWIPGPFEMGQ